MASSQRTKSRPSLRDEQKLFTRKRLLESAVKVFEERGYTAATVDDIAEVAGASRATFYAHFKSKQDVATALLEELRPSADEAFARLDDILVGGSRNDLRAWVKESMAWYEQHRAAILALEGVVAAGGFVRAGLDSAPSEAMPKFLERWGSRRRNEARFRVWLLVAQMSRTFVVREEGYLPEVDERTMVEVLTDLCASALGFEPQERPAARRRAR